MISKCRKWHLRGTDHEHGYAGPKTAIFRWQELAFLKFNLKFNSVALWIIQLQTHQEHLQLPQGGAVSALSCPAWWGICHFLRAVKTNPHLYPGVGWVGVYFDWCINELHVKEMWGCSCLVPFFSTRSRSWPARLYDRPLNCLEGSSAEYHKIKTTWLDKMDCLVPRNGEFSLKVVHSRRISFRSVEDDMNAKFFLVQT